MQKQLKAVQLFHEKFGLGVQQSPVINEAVAALRHRLMAEENDEYLQAVQEGNLLEVADALGDMLYILCGTILEHGMQEVIEEVFAEIQRSNLSKLGPDGKPMYREDGKVMKGPDFVKPDFSHLLPVE